MLCVRFRQNEKEVLHSFNAARRGDARHKHCTYYFAVTSRKYSNEISMAYTAYRRITK